MDAPEGAERILLRVMDPLGRLVYENSTNQRVAIVEIEARTLTSGLYIAGLYADGIQIGTCKFQVVR